MNRMPIDGEEVKLTPFKPAGRSLRGGGIETSHGITWIRGQMLGQGGNGSVYSAICRSKEPTEFPADSGGNGTILPYEFAVKSAEAPKAVSLCCEMDVLSDLKSSSYVVQCYGDEMTMSADGQFFYNVLMEKCSGGSLRSWIWNSRGVGLDQVNVRIIAHDILQGLVHIHSHGYVHCDIKPDNILLVPSCSHAHSFRAKIADFGSAKKARDPYADKRCLILMGTTRYMAPELLHSKIVSGFSDIWALGCVIIEMMTGKMVWSSQPSEESNSTLINGIVYGTDFLELPSDISVNGMDFLEKCLHRDAGRRWTAEKLLRHPFIWQG